MSDKTSYQKEWDATVKNKEVCANCEYSYQNGTLDRPRKVGCLKEGVPGKTLYEVHADSTHDYDDTCDRWEATND